MSKWLTRKEIAVMVECSVAQVRKNEIRFGLVEFKQSLNARCIRYECRGALAALKSRGLIK